MLTVLTRCGRLLIVAAFAIALALGTSQAVASATPMCDTPPSTCGDDDDCDGACDIYNNTPWGGGCIPGSWCCICLE